ncbi:hypothetical protein WJX72_000925 [[Myrmecia] bisecta]|uniref:CNH domain-containing protein n=1 Tax=[Myrmecia] bisecta TaxID=41462 RepID=A0AAW1PEF1_9CHLO
MQGVRVSLGARKHVGKKPINAICHLETAGRLAITCDGELVLLDHESLEGNRVPGIKGVTAIALDTKSGYPPRLAVASRTNKKSVRVLVYEVLAGADAASPFGSTALCIAQTELNEPLSVKAMAWLGKRIVVCTSLRYMLLQPFTGAYTQLFALPEDAPSPTLVVPIPSATLSLLLMDQVGIVIDASGHPTHSALTFPSAPTALAVAGLYVLAACEEGVHIYERSTASWVQSLPYPDGLRPAPGQQLLTAHNLKGTCVLVAGFRKIWMYKPIALDEQAREMLRARNFDQALQLANICAADGAPWAETAFAEAAFLLLEELRFQEAMDTLQRCSTSLFQPLELFPLFASYTAPWEPLLPSKQYWGLHSPLPSLDALVAQRRRVGPDADQELALQRVAKRCIAEYLLKVRTREGIDAPAGVDTLIVHLLADLGASGELEAFAGQPNAVAVEHVARSLTASGRHHALALLHAGAGRAAAALQIWKALEEGQLQESAGGLSRNAAQRAAVEHSARLLTDAHAVDVKVALAYLPWLLHASAEHSLHVLQARDLPVGQVLALLRPLSAKQSRLEGMRGKLQRHLEGSELYDMGVVLARLRDTPLWQEQVILHSKIGDHAAALRILALVIGDLAAAEAYCGQHGGQDSYLTLLDMLLQPGDLRPPMYVEACHLLAVQGADLDPLRVLDALSEAMPLSLAFPTLARMLRERIHRKRQGHVVRHLERAVNLSCAAERAELMCRRVVASEERACRACHTRISTKMFAVYPNGIVICYKCFRKGEAHIDPVTGRNFQQESLSSSETWPD